MTSTTTEQAAAFAKKHRVLIRTLRDRAFADPWDGTGAPSPTLHYARVESPEEKGRILSLGLTFDVGAHNCGWWRNSEYDRCLHLSLVGVGRIAFSAPTDREVQAIARAFFGVDVAKSWVEPPASAFDTYRTAPSSRYCVHLRVFYDRATMRPILPTGEVYTLKPWAEGDSPEKVFR